MGPPAPRAVLPLRPAPSGPPEGTDKKAGARQAANRLGATRRQAPPPRKGIGTAARRRAQAPPMETRQAHGLHERLGGTAGAHRLWFQPVPAAEHAGRVPYAARQDRAAGLGPRLRFGKDVPRHASHAAGRGNVSESWERRAAKVPHGSGVPDCRGSTRQGSHLLRGGRARGKSATEPCHTLPHQGSPLAHNEGPGEPPRSGVLAMRLRLAFWGDQAQPLWGAWCRAVGRKLGSQRRRWARMRAWCEADALTSRRQLVAALWDGFQKSRPIVTRDAPSCLIHLCGHRVAA